MQDAPRISVVMAVYNGERHLRETMESVLGQSFRGFEFLIVDDGSTDRTREIIRSYDDSRIRLVENERNLGLSASLNRGLRLARGELVARQDADDISEPNRLARQVEFLEAHPEVALLGTWYREIDEAGRLLAQDELPCDHVSICWRLFFVCPFVHTAVMLRRSALFGGLGLYDEAFAYAMDYELWCRISRLFRVANLAEHLVRYRSHPDSMTSTYGERALEADRLALATIARVLRWEQKPTWEIERRVRAMTALVRGTEPDHAADHILQAVTDLLHLQTAFGAEFRLAPAEAAAHRKALVRAIGYSLRARAQSWWNNGDPAVARRLLSRACQVQPRLLRERQTLRLWRDLLLMAERASA